jgi:hypothetical protein
MGPVGRWKARVDAKAMDELEYSKYPLSPDGREKLRRRYEERFQRFRERADQPPHDIEKCDYEELIIGPLRDLLSLLLDIEATPEQREQWLREHASRILKDPDARRIAREVAKKYLDGADEAKHKDYVRFLTRRKLRIFEIDNLIEELKAANGGSFGKAPMPKLPELNPVLGIESSGDSPNAEETAPTQRNAQREGRKRGPKADRETAVSVKGIVVRVAGDADWREPTKLEAIRKALDDGNIPRPRKWGDLSWRQQEDSLVIKAIQRRLETAKKTPA